MTPFQIQKAVQERQFIMLTLLAQDPMNEAGEPTSPPAELVIFHQHSYHRAIANMLQLLETLYAHGVSSPHVLRLVLTAISHKIGPVALHTPSPSANRSEPVEPGRLE